MLFQTARAVFKPGLPTTTRWTSRSARPPTGRRSASTTTPTATSIPARPCSKTAPRSASTGWRSRTAGSRSRRSARSPEADKQRLFAACVARSLNGQLAFEASARPETEATVARLDIDFAAHVRPTAGMFWSRVRKDRMLSVAKKVLGLEWAHTHRKDKKDTLAGAMETAFARAGAPPLGVTREGHAAALAWAPPGFAAFDTGQAEDDAAAAQPDADTGAAAPAEAPADTGHVEQPAPAEDAAPAETAVSPDADGTEEAAPTVQDAIDAANAVPVEGGGPRVIVGTVGFETPAGDAGESSAGDAPPAPPVPGNGHDPAADGTADPLALPAFLRRS